MATRTINLKGKPFWLIKQTDHDQEERLGEGAFIPPGWEIYLGRGIELCVILDPNLDEEGDILHDYIVSWGVRGESAEGSFETDNWLQVLDTINLKATKFN